MAKVYELAALARLHESLPRQTIIEDGWKVVLAEIGFRDDEAHLREMMRQVFIAGSRHVVASLMLSASGPDASNMSSECCRALDAELRRIDAQRIGSGLVDREVQGTA